MSTDVIPLWHLNPPLWAYIQNEMFSGRELDLKPLEGRCGVELMVIAPPEPDPIPPPPPQAPVAVIGVDSNTGRNVPFTVQFTGSESSDGDNDIVEYRWNFGDRGTSTEMDPGHTYNVAGHFTATLKVTDSTGLTSETFVNIWAGVTPVV